MPNDSAANNSLNLFAWGPHCVYVADEGSGEPVVLLHSSGLSGRQWRRLSELLLSKNFRTIVPDLLGSGRSSAWPEGHPFSFHYDVEVVEALLDRIDGPAHLVGHSYGGLIALRAAAVAPTRVRSLALYDPVVFGVLDEHRDRDALADLSPVRFSWSVSPAEREAWLEGFANYWNGPDAWKQLQAPVRSEFARVGWVVHEGARSLVADRAPASTYTGLRIPTVLLTGTESPLAAGRIIERLAEALPNARIESTAGAGHMGPLTHADRVNEIIAAQIVAAKEAAN